VRKTKIDGTINNNNKKYKWKKVYKISYSPQIGNATKTSSKQANKHNTNPNTFCATIFCITYSVYNEHHGNKN